MAEFVQVLTTVDSEEAAVTLARGIVEARLAACVQIVGPIRSVYWWDGEVDDVREWQLLMKSSVAVVVALLRARREDIPAVVRAWRGRPDRPVQGTEATL